ncbi:hypothetical protein Tsubulata_015279 [Turnera subulata]|uniref:Myb-like domain-containing protein n=1 Tax=Turnera subulata TaxID=218843 RepID=A0A9Q0FHJ9_9ROSI|nr:hypothetical protein Tsubulata_015279 [Turnera subulata]
MAPKNGDAHTKKTLNRGAWTAEEDRKLAEFIEVHGAKRWKTIAAKSAQAEDNGTTEAEKPESMPQDSWTTAQAEDNGTTEAEKPEVSFDVNEFFDFSSEGTYGLDWVNEFLELDNQDPLFP